ncbi:uncharacterized domain HDIG-containing protein [Chthonomonas calidirosea]|uniref:Uncharacterized domain HDIG n=1 Tax=Chthonomonas calidirosea (strain DSM 23976 / ICMP 18418 / T49) TaxID=1303518 RepID=S0F016_CHTCT|nr:HDIG domain-containing metalloprotein [Chthonomonas calidirosea]CCW36336.1 uncharacterized domain HDIG [Chthonomonas calidirosea T49]CEK17636.1 uncharacterized domain HDIG-containing protein [Chthonomonas calidirosea]
MTSQNLSEAIEDAIHRLREATRGTPYEGRLYLVGGLLRDRELGIPSSPDLDIVLEGDAVELAYFLHKKGLSTHAPVVYPRFGTARITVATAQGVACTVELVSARAESYRPESRKPEVQFAGLREDVYRRDFTINTLLENLHTGELLDLTGLALADLRAKIIRTPLDPAVTFYDDPLRMLRAVRFAARFDFEIEPKTKEGIMKEAYRLSPPTISYERIRDEFVKIVLLDGPKAHRGLQMLLELKLLHQFLPEMVEMVGCQQGGWHRYDVWDHTLVALECLPPNASLTLRLGLLWHDIGKPRTRTEVQGQIRFYHHATVGAEMVREMMRRLKFSNEEIEGVTTLVKLHMRPGEYRPDWSDAAVKRLIRECGPYLEDLLTLAECDVAATVVPEQARADIAGLRARIAQLNADSVRSLQSPLDGKTIMQLLNVKPGPVVGQAKEFLINEVIEGRLAPDDREAAKQKLLSWWQQTAPQAPPKSQG